MGNVATMVLNDITCIDHAFVDFKDGESRIRGGSLHLSVKVRGKVDSNENVVVDFSNFKKTVKDYIDGPDGFDHKLWVPINSDTNDFGVSVTHEDDKTIIVGSTFSLFVPSTGVRFCDIDSTDDLYDKYKNCITESLLSHLEKEFPSVGIEIETWFDEDFHTMKSSEHFVRIPFRYIHGLKHSSSYGCQNIAHGHLSEIALETTEEISQESLMLIKVLFSDIVFAWEENIDPQPSNSIITSISYKSERGAWYMHLVREFYNIYVLKTETTIEHLVEYIRGQIQSILGKNKITSLYVSEGLDKGACV